MTAGPPLAAHQHQQRAQRHLTIGSALEGAGDEWAAVPLFYSAYHLVKVALLNDPIFGDLDRLKGKHRHLTPDERWTSRHHGRRTSQGPKQWGINELVATLYPRDVAIAYEQLHVASNRVRYGNGLPPGALPDLRIAIDLIHAASADGGLVA